MPTPLLLPLLGFLDLPPALANIPVTAVSRNKTIMGLSLLLLHSRFLLKGKQFYQECQSNVKTSALCIMQLSELEHK